MSFFVNFSILASLLHVYDSSWQLESVPILIGALSNIGNHDQEAPASSNSLAISFKKKDIITLKRWMIMMGAGHLLTAGMNLGDSKKFTHICNTLMDKIETRHGSKLKPLVRQMVQKQNMARISTIDNHESSKRDRAASKSSNERSPLKDIIPSQGKSRVTYELKIKNLGISML